MSQRMARRRTRDARLTGGILHGSLQHRFVQMMPAALPGRCVDEPARRDHRLQRLDGRRVPFAVTSCTGYSDLRRAALRDMEDLAWVLRSDATTSRIGFVPARRLKPADRYVLPDEWD